MAIRLHKGDLPDLNSPEMAAYDGMIAVDTEALGLNPHRDRLCVVQLSAGDGNADLVQIAQGQREAPNLKALLEDPKKAKIFHYARYDIAMLRAWLAIGVTPIFCTKVASRLTRTYTDRHGLKDLTRELLGIDLSKQQQSSDWAADELTEEQKNYAASDVLYLHALAEILRQRLERDKRLPLALASFGYLPTRAVLDLAGWGNEDIFSHS